MGVEEAQEADATKERWARCVEEQSSDSAGWQRRRRRVGHHRQSRRSSGTDGGAGSAKRVVVHAEWRCDTSDVQWDEWRRLG
jgi:hypothetical protein